LTRKVLGGDEVSASAAACRSTAQIRAATQSGLWHSGGFVKGTVLVVDDDSSIRDAVSAIITHIGYTVETAISGEMALSVIRLLRTPFVVVLDLGLPDMPGEEVIERLRQDRRFRQFAIVVFSGSPQRFSRLPSDLFRVLEKLSGANELPKVVEAAFGYLERTTPPIAERLLGG
jgi:CheY-like chemotaxis protein